MSTLNDLDIATPLVGSTIDELAAEVRNLKTILKNVLLVAHAEDGSIEGSAISEVADEAIGTAQLAEAGVTADKLSADSVMTVHIINANVTGPKIAAGALTASHFTSLTPAAGSCIPPTAFGYASIPMDRLAAQVTTSMLGDASVTAGKLASASVTDAKIVSVSTSKLTTTGVTDNQVLTYTTALGWHAATPATLPAIGVAVLGEIASGSGGEVSTVEVWNARLLAITQNESTPIATVDANGLNFTVGKFFLFVRCPAKCSGSHMTRLVRKTLADSTTSVVAWGSTGFNAATDDVQTDSILYYAFTEAAIDTYSYYIEHYIEATSGTDDLGVDANIVVDTVATNNQHTSGFIFKIP